MRVIFSCFIIFTLSKISFSFKQLLLFFRTLKLNKSLRKYESVYEPNFLKLLTRSTLGAYLKDYTKRETINIQFQCRLILNEYYQSKGHQKRAVQPSTFRELKRDLQAMLLTTENFGDETFLDEDVAMNILHESKNAFTRCGTLCETEEAVSEMTMELLGLLINYLYTEHIEYAIELALYCTYVFLMALFLLLF